MISATSIKLDDADYVILHRWSIQHGFVTLPKSARQDRLLSNADVGGFEISKEDMDTMDGLDEHLVTDW